MRERRDKYVPEWKKNDNLDPPVIHPDITFATRNYDGTKISFQHCFELRNEALAKGKKYWFHEFDDEHRRIAEERTKVAAAKGWRWKRVGQK